MIDLKSTLREIITAGVDVHASCPNGHEYQLDLEALSDIVGPLFQLDEVVLTKSWCPQCGRLANTFEIRTIH